MKAAEDDRGPYDSMVISPLYQHKKKCKIKTSMWNDYGNRVVKGDYVVLRIGKKKYKKTYKKQTREGKVTWKFKVKGARAGTKVRVAYYNKFKQKLCSQSTIVWKSKRIHLGDTRRQVRLTYGFGKPRYINYSAYSEQWVFVYGRSRWYVYFRNGRVSNWQL